MEKLNIKKIVIFIIHGLILWAICGLTVYVGMSVTSIDIALIIHAIAAPIIACLISFVYFKALFNYKGFKEDIHKNYDCRKNYCRLSWSLMLLAPILKNKASCCDG